MGTWVVINAGMYKMIERTIALLNQCRRLAKDVGASIASFEA